MARIRAAKNRALRPWASANLDCKDGRFIQVGNSLLLSKTFQSLKPTARNLYFTMMMESAGKPSFKYSHGTAKKYGFPPTSFDRAIKELKERGFVELIQDDEHAQFKANEYKFISNWKADPAIHFGDRQK